jgi:type I restriction enzyme S subunit
VEKYDIFGFGYIRGDVRVKINFEVPKNWNFSQVHELVDSKKGSIKIGPFGSALKKAEFSNDGIRVLGIDHVYPNKLVWEKPKFIPLKKYSELTQYTVSPGDILVTNMGTVGRTCYVPTDFPQSKS